MGCCNSNMAQVVILGPTDSGKTSLLYSLCSPGWRRVVKDKVTTEVFNYEKVTMGRKNFCAWDIPGSVHLMNLKGFVYRSVVVSGCIYVVDALELQLSHEKLMSAALEFRFLVNEDELREAPFCLFLNIKSPKVNADVAESLKLLFTARFGLDDPILRNRCIVVAGSAMEGYQYINDISDFFFG